MKTKLAASVTLLAVLTLCRPVSAQAAPQIFDLNADWSEVSNPNGVWTYRADASLLTFDSPPITNPGGVPAWVGPDGYLPIWFKYLGADYYDMHTGDVIAHSANDNSEGVFNVLWTAPSGGTINVSGAAWFAAEEGSQSGRSSVWSLWLNGNLMTSGEVAWGDVYDRSSPFHFSLGSGGAGVLQNVLVAVGDQLMLQVQKETGQYGTFVGLNWTITLTPLTCVPLPSGAVAWWRAEGNVQDSVGSHHGTLGGGLAFVPGMAGQAFNLDGVDDFVGVPHSDDFNPIGPFSVEVWIKAAASQFSPDGYFLIIDKSHGFTDFTGWTMQGDPTGKVLFVFGNGVGWPPGASTLTSVLDDQWHHLAGVFTGPEVQIYLDGVLQSTAPQDSLPAGNMRDVMIGRAWGGGSPRRYFHGLIDEPTFYNRALTATEIQATYSAGSAGKCLDCTPIVSGLTSWWPGEGNASDALGSNNGSLLGGVSFTPAVVGSGFAFANNGDGVTIPHDASLDVSGSGFSVEFWMRATGSQPERYSTLFDKSHGAVDTSGWAFQTDRDTGQMIFSIGQSAGFASAYSTTDVLDGDFHHIAGSWESGLLRLFVDGVFETSIPIVSPANNNRPVNMGFWWGGGTPSQFFRGILDEPKLYHRTLSAQEIASIYNCQAACQPPSIMGQPQNQNVCLGASVTFSVSASGTEPLNHQWSKDGSDIPGATSSVLILSSVTAADAGGYRVRVENVCGVAESSVAVLAVEVSQCVAVPVGVVASWKADGNAEDSVGMLAGSIAGGVTFAPGRVGQAFSLDGIGGQIQVPHSCAISYGPTTPMTVELWVYRTSPGPVQHILGKRDVQAGPMNYQLAFDNNQISWGNLQGGAGAAGTLPMNTWTHLAGSFDGGMFKLYVNGALAGTGPGIMGPETTAPLIFGTSGQHQPFGGLIDEVAFYNRALADTEIQAIYAAGCAGKCSQNCFAPAIARPPLNETICLDGTATFTVCAAGREPLSYQWRHQGVEIPGATTATLTISPVLSAHAGSYTVQIQNACGDVTSEPAMLTVLDAPPAITLNGPATVILEACTDAYVEPGATGVDDCDGPLPVVIGGDTVNVNLPGTYVISYSAMDSAGHTGTATRTVTVTDTVNPAIVCPANIVTSTDAGQSSAVVNFAATATDHCPGVTISYNPASGSVFPKGTTTVTATATDASGNMSLCMFTVTVNDTENPAILCPANIVTSTDAGQCSAVVSFTATATDNDPGVTISYNPASGSVFPKGTTPVTATATDASGNASTCTFTVNVNDTENPAITCPANITRSNDADACGALVTYTAPVGTDNCPGATTVQTGGLPSGSLFPVGTTVNTFEVTDAAGNKSSCSFSVIVTETQPPAIACPADIVAGTDPGQCSAAVNVAATATDNCPGVTISYSPASGSVFLIGRTTVMATATDASGNTSTCTFTVTVNDTEGPAIACPANIVASTDAGHSSAVVNFAATATDNCPGVMISYSPASGSVFPKGTTTVTATATDASGNMSTCTFTVSVNDTENPAITCPANIVAGTDAGQCSALVNFTATATDNDPGVTIIYNPASGSIFPKGTTAVTATATDASGNMSTCTFTVTVNDTENPAILCPANITRSNDADACGALVTYAAPVGTDNCPGATTVQTGGLASGSVFPVGTTVNTFEVTDAAGNKSSGSFSVIVTETQPPAIGCPANIVSGTDPGQSSAVVNFIAAATDNCPGVTISYSPASGSVFPIGTTTVTATATDATGNSSLCTFTVTVNDTESPAITCQANMTVTGSGPTLVTFIEPGATDNCGAASVVCIPASGSSFLVGTTTVTCTATDAVGNSANCSFTVTVQADAPGCEDIQATPDRSRIHFDEDGNSRFAFFRGNLSMSEGNLASDFRVAPGDTAQGSLKVTVGGTVVYEHDLTFTIHDHNDPSDNREKWTYNSGPMEKMFLRWKDDQQYEAIRDPNLPISPATGNKNLGKLETRFIHDEETRFRYNFKDATRPITITVDGLVLLTVRADGTVSSPFPMWKYGKTVEVLYPDRLVPGNTIAWYADGDLSNNGGLPENLTYQHDAAANGNSTDTYFNAGGRFFIKVPVTGLTLPSQPPAARVEFSLGQPGVTLVGCVDFSVSTYSLCGKNWKHNDGPDDDEEDDD